jgi:uncharacterized protein
VAAVRADIGWPLRFDQRGRTADAHYDAHVYDLVDLLLFTNPGERVMRSDFGCGLLDLCFEGNSPELAATVEMAVQAQIERWLGDVIEIDGLRVESSDATVLVRLKYRVLATGSRRSEEFIGRADA